MSNLFYKYISSLLVEYFSQMDLSAGDRFFLRLDQPADVKNLVQVMKEHDTAEDFFYRHDLGETYKTFSIPFGEVKLVIANTSESVKPDFLVTLRNLTGEQKKEFENTVLLSIVSEQLDSIQGGSSDLQKEGMPLHPRSIFQDLKSNIEKSDLDRTEQIILIDNLNNLLKEQEVQRITFFEFEDIFTTLQKGEINDQDYAKFGLFKDADLHTFKGKEQQKRLNENRRFFEFVKQTHDFNYDEDTLQRMFSPQGAKQLKSDDWKGTSFAAVNKFHEDYIRGLKDLKLTYKNFHVPKSFEVWDRSITETAAGKRKRNIIIFNPEAISDTEFKIEFELQGKINRMDAQHLTVDAKDESKLNVNVGKNYISGIITSSSVKPLYFKLKYKHENKASLSAEFNILVVPFSAQLLMDIKSSYAIDSKKEFISLNYEDGEISFGNGPIEKSLTIEKNDEAIQFTMDESVKISPQPEAFNDDEKLTFTLIFDHIPLKIMLESSLQSSVPISGSKLWEQIREKREDVKWIKENNRLELGNRQYYIHAEYKEFIYWEERWIEEGYRHGKIIGDELVQEEIQLSEELSEAYSRYLNVFKIKKTISSFSTITEDLEKRANEYITVYNKEIADFQEGMPVGKKGVDLFKLGILVTNEMLFFTPFHPLMVAYKLKMFELLKQEEVDNSISHRLSAEALIPYINDLNSNELFKSDHQMSAPEWLVFKSVKKVTVSDANQYLAKLVSDKLAQFREHFAYLFIEKSNAPIKINVINIENDTEVLKGILQWMLGEISSKKTSVKPMEITLYKTSSEDSAFDEFAFISSAAEFEEKYGINLSKVEGLESEDVLRMIRENLSFYKTINFEKLKYAHISYYKMHAQQDFAIQSVKKMNTGISLEGLYTSVPSMKDEEWYKSGFGIKGYELEEDNLLVSTAFYINELASNLGNKGGNSYKKGEVLLSTTRTTDTNKLDQVFESSYWVTFVDPAVDLEFFNDYSDDLVVIHYSDQYSSSSRFDAITVTKKANQYYAVIKEFLNQKEVAGTDENVLNTIKAFNTFNGEWLLRIIGSKGHFDREKLSIISAIKYAISYFDHSNILWVPISMEEILRVAGAVSLNKKDGVFTAKNLGVTGRHSDDLLLLGLESIGDKVYLHFYPVEVKIGINSNDVMKKAIEQVHQTKKVIVDALTGDKGKSFTGQFYKNFFVQLLIANARKLEVSKLWPEKNYSVSDSMIEKLLKAEYEIGEHLTPFIGEGSVLSFKKEAHLRSVNKEDDVLIMNLPEQDGYEGLVKSISNLWHWIQQEETDFIKEEMLSTLYNPREDSNVLLVSPAGEYKGETDHSYAKNYHDTSVNKVENSVLERESQGISDVNTRAVHERIIEDMTEIEPTEVSEAEPKKMSEMEPVKIPEIEPGKTSETEPEEMPDREPEPMPEITPEKMPEEKPEPESEPEIEPEPIPEFVENRVTDLKNIRIKIGKAANSNRDIYWEFGNPALANRHLLISGGSGQGKTYFMQCLLLEKSKLGLSSIVIDYTEGFLPNQLEPEFVEYLGPKLKQKVVISEKLPINPFKRNVRNIGGLELPESNTDIAERVKSVFSSVYKSLGIQQQNAIYEAVREGMDQYGDSMDFKKLKDLLEDAGTSYAKTALSQIRPLIDRDLFDFSESIDWKKITEADGEVFIIQLTLFPRDVQLVITEFILWDIWNYSVRFGSKNHPLPVLMDEAQNLDHTEKSPSARILTEGRKFGWSGWYATQFLKSQLGADELARLQNAAEKVYFLPPEQELSNVAASLSKDNSEKKIWEAKLAHLKKGQCIVHSPILKENGELSTPLPTVVNISPLSERI
ncbi:DNA phosphorothioation-dependent restriction protein DptH [Planococcus glaciei]|uniref:DNA phosphorothioation-dependent restriction protein DptH n=1 Tax=Planococcus glaciei TaxID=459472 RepID=UPI00069E0010|nr:DNA phosphorothioation-dependent restriction protein DptH [Planococcus glaciei]